MTDPIASCLAAAETDSAADEEEPHPLEFRFPGQDWSPFKDTTVPSVMGLIETHMVSTTGKTARAKAGDIRIGLLNVMSADHVDPLLETLRALPQWDTVPRIDTTFWTLFDNPIPPFHFVNPDPLRGIMTALLARARTPGCFQDTVPIIIGPTGCGKDSFLKAPGARPSRSGGRSTTGLARLPQVARGCPYCNGVAPCRLQPTL